MKTYNKPIAAVIGACMLLAAMIVYQFYRSALDKKNASAKIEFSIEGDPGIRFEGSVSLDRKRKRTPISFTTPTNFVFYGYDLNLLVKQFTNFGTASIIVPTAGALPFFSTSNNLAITYRRNFDSLPLAVLTRGNRGISPRYSASEWR